MKTDLSAPPSRAASLGANLALAASVLAGLILVRLSAYGIWDPWELSVADAARRYADGVASHPVPLAVRLIAASFAAFGAREWAGRLPLALSGLALLLLIGAWTRLFAARRTAFYAALVLASTPYFVLHSREMVGATPAFATSALVMLGASAVVFADRPSGRTLLLGIFGCALGAVLGALSAGVLNTVLPPLVAVTLTAALSGRVAETEGPQRKAVLGVFAATAFVVVMVARALVQHAADANLWIFAAPQDGAVVTYERVVEHLFHGFAPWSAVLPVALGTVLRSPREWSRAQLLGALCVLWASLAYAAQSVFLSSYGNVAFMAPGALSVAVALWLSERERTERMDLAELIVVLLMLGLIIRDFGLYPASPFAGLELGEARVPTVFNPKRAWSLVLGLFGLTLLLTSVAGGERAKLDPKAPYRQLGVLWNRSLGHKAWLVTFAALLLGLLVFGALAFIAPVALKLTSLGTRIGRVVFFVPVAIPLGILGAQVVYRESVRLRELRSILLVVSGLAVGFYTSQVFLPQLSSHLSPRGVFDTYNELAKKGEPLAQHRIEGRAATFYAHGEVRDFSGQSELVSFLASPGRKWAAFPTEDMSEIDVAFRRRTGKHLFVPSLRNGKVTLAANEPIKGAENTNPLASTVKKQPVPVEFPVNADFDGKVELLGYNLELPRKDTVGPGQTFHVTWVWRAKQSNIGNYKVFLHVDSGDQRINGDHDPVDEKYPVRLWDQGDIIIDRQAVSIPATSPAGVYTMFVGLFRGESRLSVTQGSHDGNRVRAGTIRVQ